MYQTYRNFRPVDSEDFGFPLNLSIGTTEGEGADNFQLMVVTPKYLQTMYPGQSAVLLRHVLLVFHYDFNEILDVLARYIQPIEEDSWEKIAARIGRIALWEFDDYQPYQSPTVNRYLQSLVSSGVEKIGGLIP